MKRFFWLLVIVNLSLLTYFNVGYLMPGKPEIKLSEINPDKIKVLSEAEIEALPRKKPEPPATAALPPAEPQPAASCYEWGSFSDTSLANAQKQLSRMAIQAAAKEQNTEQPKRYWVYRPPLKTAAEAQKKAAEFKALGVNDLFVVQEDKWKNAISFGIFEDEQLATKLMQELQAKGVKNIEKILRTNGKGHYSLALGSLNENQIAELRKLQPNFPAAELKQVDCH